eukprot:bmy_18797T0
MPTMKEEVRKREVTPLSSQNVMIHHGQAQEYVLKPKYFAAQKVISGEQSTEGSFPLRFGHDHVAAPLQCEVSAGSIWRKRSSVRRQTVQRGELDAHAPSSSFLLCLTLMDGLRHNGFPLKVDLAFKKLQNLHREGVRGVVQSTHHRWKLALRKTRLIPHSLGLCKKGEKPWSGN